MKMHVHDVERWQGAGDLAVAAWLAASPWILGYASETSASWNSFGCAAIIVIAAILMLTEAFAAAEWVEGAVGVWLIVSPWLLGFASIAAAMANAIIIGAAILALAGWQAQTLTRTPA